MATLEVFDRFGRGGVHVDLKERGDRLSIGRSRECDVVLDDTTVSRSHAKLERVGPGWSIEDADSANGTVVNGERVFVPRALHDGDEITLGRARLLFRDGSARKGTATDPVAPPPQLTPAERRVLVELMRPIRSGSRFVEPASRAEIAGRLFVTEAAVQNNFANLYRKFDIPEHGSGSRRKRLADEAWARGSVDPREFDDDDDGER